jgi:hypothetical protein
MSETQASRVVSARSCRASAQVFDWGNLIAVSIAGVPLMLAGGGTVGYGTILAAVLGIVPVVLWFGASMFVYAMLRHHPNEKVGHYIQHAAYRYYPFLGALVVVGTFFPPELIYYQVYWAIAAAILIPWSIWALRRIRRDDWQDTPIPEPSHG